MTAEAGDGTVELSWDAVEGAQSYNVYFKVNDDSGVTKDDEVIVGVTTASLVHEGLTNGSTYYYRVAAVNTVGEGSLSNEATATPLPNPPGAPQNLAAVPGNRQVSLSWNAVEGAESYTIYFKVNDDSGVTTADESIPATTNSFVHEGLTNGNTYYYRVSAVSPLDIEGGLSGEASAALAPPAQPQSVQAVAGPFRVTVSWDAVDGATAYNVYWKSGTGGVTTSDAKIDVSGELTEVVHTGLDAGTPYFYIVTAVNPVGEGTASTEVSATPTVAAQAVMVAAGPTTTSATCAVMSAGTVRCVGWYPGDGREYTAEPVEVTGISAATHVSVGVGHACAVDGGLVKCWGAADLEPVTVSGITAATMVEAGSGCRCAIEGGEVKCWGTVIGVDTDATDPVVVPLPRPASQVSLATRNARACAILPDPDPESDPELDPELWCWGVLPIELGQDPAFCDLAICPPVQVPMVTAEWISVGRTHACYLQTLPGEVACLGGAAAQFFSPLDEPISFDEVSSGEDFNCGYTPEGSVTCWGFNGNGQLGDGTVSPHPSYSYTHPVTAIGVNAATSISAGGLHACAVDDGVVKCWGAGYGSTPVVVIGF